MLLISEQNVVVLEVWAGDPSPRICDSGNLGCGPMTEEEAGTKGDGKVCNGISGTGPY